MSRSSSSVVRGRKPAPAVTTDLIALHGDIIHHASFLDSADPAAVRREIAAWLNETLGPPEPINALQYAPGAPLVEEGA